MFECKIKYLKSDRWLLKLDAQSKSFELLRDRTLGIEEKPSEMTELQQIEANPTEIKTPPKKKMKTDQKKKQKMKPRQIGLANSGQNHHIIPNGPVPNYSSIRPMVPNMIPSFTLSLGQPQILSHPVIRQQQFTSNLTKSTKWACVEERINTGFEFGSIIRKERLCNNDFLSTNPVDRLPAKPKKIIFGDGLYNNPSRVTPSITKNFQVRIL